MKIIIALSLYFVGVIVESIWVITSKDFHKRFEKSINENPDLQIIPEGIVRIILILCVMLLCLAWPIDLIRFPIQALKNKDV